MGSIYLIFELFMYEIIFWESVPSKQNVYLRKLWQKRDQSTMHSKMSIVI